MFLFFSALHTKKQSVQILWEAAEYATISPKFRISQHPCHSPIIHQLLDTRDFVNVATYYSHHEHK